MTIKQQIIISGVGGQGVLFVTRLLAEAAMMKGYPVLTSETHGMAQRGGTVVSHLKVGDFSSPLIRPFSADGLLALKPESLTQHGCFVKPGGWAIVNSSQPLQEPADLAITSIDAESLASAIGNLKSVNLIMLGAALARFSDSKDLFCTLDDIQAVLNAQLTGAPSKLEKFTAAIDAGYRI
ncbi:MAG: 2-oxoacid:acceptor oxidoreductase family protein [Deltaproteobacteria bacterium]|nr:2-oxoacid:acceptor oxidoreductase family protein [Deltaproteobacteria bacterium]